MSFVNILGAWTTWSRLSGNNDDDWVDRLNHVYTVLVLVIFAIFIAGGQNIGDPISCWESEYVNTGNRMKYVTSYCWIMNTYRAPMHEDLPKEQKHKFAAEVTYYQYIPLILLLMALLFKLPNMAWRALSGYSGIRLEKIVELTASAHYLEGDKRAEKVGEIAQCVDRWLEANRQYHYNILVRLRQKLSKLCCCFLNRREGTYLTGLYMIIKILYFVNVVCQFFLLDIFLGGFFSLWGVEAVANLATEYRMKESIRFPRVTLCDFKTRQMINVQDHTVQCVLPWNLFNEKIFLVIWFWLVMVAVVTGVNMFCWFWRTVFKRNNCIVVKKYLKLNSRLQTELDKKVCKKFAGFLRDDGIFLTRMIQKNSNDILATDIVCKLWDIYLEKPMIKKMVATIDGSATHNYM